MTRPLVLVPGACLGGWCWRETARDLRERGHDVYPVTLTGLGERVHLASPEIDLETHVEDVVQLLDHERLDDAVVVGHSYAGAVITGVADRRPERLSALVYLDTAPLGDGQAIADVQSEAQRAAQRDAVGSGWLWPVPDRATLASGLFGSAAGLDEAGLALLERLATPQPYATFTTPLRLTRAAAPPLERTVILCTAGGASRAELLALIDSGDPRAAPFAGGGWRVEEIAGGHWPMFSAPAELAALLAGVAA